MRAPFSRGLCGAKRPCAGCLACTCKSPTWVYTCRWYQLDESRSAPVLRTVHACALYIFATGTAHHVHCWTAALWLNLRSCAADPQHPVLAPPSSGFSSTASPVPPPVSQLPLRLAQPTGATRRMTQITRGLPLISLRTHRCLAASLRRALSQSHTFVLSLLQIFCCLLYQHSGASGVPKATVALVELICTTHVSPSTACLTGEVSASLLYSAFCGCKYPLDKPRWLAPHAHGAEVFEPHWRGNPRNVAPLLLQRRHAVKQATAVPRDATRLRHANHGGSHSAHHCAASQPLTCAVSSTQLSGRGITRPIDDTAHLREDSRATSTLVQDLRTVRVNISLTLSPLRAVRHKAPRHVGVLGTTAVSATLHPRTACALLAQRARPPAGTSTSTVETCRCTEAHARGHLRHQRPLRNVEPTLRWGCAAHKVQSMHDK